MKWTVFSRGIGIRLVRNEEFDLLYNLAVRHFGDNRQAMLSQIPLAMLMVLYTALGLWLLSTPVAT